jgi:phosphate transport system permease protein
MANQEIAQSEISEHMAAVERVQSVTAPGNTAHYRWRQVKNIAMIGVTVISALISVAALVAIIGYVAVNGFAALNVNFFTKEPTPIGIEGGGVVNANVGTLIMVGLAIVMAVPVGVGAGIYLSEFGRNQLASVIRYLTDVLSGVPSIVMGIFAFTLFVLQSKNYSAFAGGFALAVMMLPLVTRTTEEMLRFVPQGMREGALALGAPRWRTTFEVVLPMAARGILTGIVLAIARVAGETAPLLFTALGNQFLSTDIGQPMDSLPHLVYFYGISPYDEWRAKAWGAALVLAGIVLIASLLVRFVGRQGTRA